MKWECKKCEDVGCEPCFLSIIEEPESWPSICPFDRDMIPDWQESENNPDEIERLKVNQDKLITACEQLMCCIWHDDCEECLRERICNFSSPPSNPAKTTLALIAKIREQP